MKLHKILFSLSCLFSTFLALTPKAAISTYAAQPEQEKIEITTPFEDLCEDEQFVTDYANGAYKFDENKQIEFLNFYEYKYEDVYSSSFGLYVYFYNPNNTKLVNLFSNRNKIQLSTDGNHYYKYDLIPISRSTGEILNLFYKFKVNVNKSFHDNLNSESRKYSVSSFEFDFQSTSLVEDIEIGSTYTFTGYAAGCNGNEESTLVCEKEGLETIKLKVHGGYKRSGYINQGLTKAIDLHYVYFEIPNKYINTYGQPYGVSYEFYDYYLDKGLWNIDKDKSDYYPDAKWWQVKNGTKSIDLCVWAEDPFCWQNQPLEARMDRLWEFNNAKGELNVNLSKDNWANFNASGRSFYDPSYVEQVPDAHAYIDASYKYKNNLWRYSPDYLDGRLFRGKNWNTVISKNDIDNRINKYGINYFSTKKNQKYSGVISTTIEDLVDPVTPNLEHPNFNSWLALFDNTPCWGRTQDSGVAWSNVPAFEAVTHSEDSNGSSYTIDKGDVTHFNNIFNKTSANDTTMCILRFAETEYWSSPIWFQRPAILFGSWETRKIGYSAFPHIIDRFDILSLSFRISDEITVIPVVSDPIRIVPNADPPVDDRPENTSWWETLLNSGLNIKRIIGIVAGVILVFVALVVISKIVGAISTKRALKANKITIKESKKRRRDKNRHEG